jgi:hypothetical protein
MIYKKNFHGNIWEQIYLTYEDGQEITKKRQIFLYVSSCDSK